MVEEYTRQLDILLAEDKPSDIELFQMALKKCGRIHSLHIVRDGREVIGYLLGERPFDDPHRPVPNLIFMDFRMSRMTGIDVLNWLRRQPQYCVIPTIILSSSACDNDIMNAYRSGATAFFTKPALLDDLKEILQSIINFCCHAEYPPLLSFPRLPSDAPWPRT